MLDYKPNIVLSNEEFNVVGKRPIRPDGAEKVTGRARYGADQSLPGLLYGKILRSPHSHAVIKSIDTSEAEAYPGVRAVVTSADWPETSGRLADLAEGAIQNLGFLSMNVLARGKALYKGHAIAAVAAGQRPRGRAGAGAHQGGLRSPHPRSQRRRRHEARRSRRSRAAGQPVQPRAAPRRAAGRGRRRRGQQHRQPVRVPPRRRGGRLQAGRHHRREGNRDGSGASGLHRTPRRHRPVECRRQADHLVQQPGGSSPSATTPPGSWASP